MSAGSVTATNVTLAARAFASSRPVITAFAASSEPSREAGDLSRTATRRRGRSRPTQLQEGRVAAVSSWP